MLPALTRRAVSLQSYDFRSPFEVALFVALSIIITYDIFGVSADGYLEAKRHGKAT